MHLDAYIDGSYNNKYHCYGSGIVFILDNNKVVRYQVAGNNRSIKKYNNVAGEILASVTAIEIARRCNCDYLTIHHDFKGANTEYLKSNSKKAFIKNYLRYIELATKGKTIINDKEVEKYKPLNIKFEHVKSKSNSFYNDLADMLSRESCSKLACNIG